MIPAAGRGQSALKDLLTDYATQAKPYDVVARALTLGRRRRAAKRVAAGLATLILVAAIGLVRGWLVGTGSLESAAPVLPPPINLAGFPAVVTPQPNAPAMPKNKVVGSGALIYQLRDTGGTYLVAGDGQQYRLDDPSTPAGATFGLSPDRRWLVTSGPGGQDAGVTIQDLSSPEHTTFSLAQAPLAWSPDGRWLVLGARATDSPGSVEVVDVGLLHRSRRGIAVDLGRFPRTEVVSVQANGDLVLAPIDASTYLDLTVVDTATATERRHVHVEITTALTPEERSATVVLPAHLVFTRAGLLVLPTMLGFGSADAGRTYYPKDLLLVDPGTQSVLKRWVLPTPKSIPGQAHDIRESWQAIEVRADGVLLQHRTPTKILSLELYRPESGLFLVTDLTALPGK